ncbi:hypothetical protein [Vibrio jasicida]|uniref:hypothetical protein n=1 Tax=Vibrio jasicida TaxID=766224 RepID=UPI0005EEF91E|nr:hypothetical protein [Vibrio jasicida]
MDDQIAKIIKKHYPEISNGWHVPVWGVITSINETPTDGVLSDEFRPYYAANIKVMTKKGKDSGIEMPNVAITSSFSESGGVLQLPKPGAVVSVQFLWGLPNKPYIDKVLPFGVALPETKTDELTLQSKRGVKVHLTQTGDIEVATDAAIISNSAERHTTTVNDHIERENVTSVTQGNVTETVGNVYQLAAIGAMYLLTTGNAEFSALGKMTLTSVGDLVEDVYSDRLSTIKGKLDMRVKEGTVRIGNEKVDITNTLYELIDIVSQMATTLATHTHTAPHGPTTAPIEGGQLSGHSSQSEALATKLKPIVS